MSRVGLRPFRDQEQGESGAVSRPVRGSREQGGGSGRGLRMVDGNIEFAVRPLRAVEGCRAGQ